MSHEIAIVGISCRFPGADNPLAYWDLLANACSAITEVPSSRWDSARFYDPDPSVPGKANTKWGGFLANPGACDNGFFNLTADEAVHVDPQQRLVLELAWEALEDAGIAPDSLKGSQAAVYVGISHNDYERIIYQRYERITQFHGTGSYQSVAAARVSYFLNIAGPSIAVDTACSSTLTALHVACAALRHDNIPLALVGGVTLHLTPDETIGLTKGRMLSGDGRCKSFDKSADGYVRGEGGGVLVLKRLEDAVRDRDRIYGVVKGTAVNHNGRSNGLSAPSGLALKKVMEQGLASAGIDAAEVTLIEAHGTGTRLGDQIELKAIREVYDGRSSDELWLGCSKTNIGHLETASGMASIIKVLLAMQHRSIPPNLHFTGASGPADPTTSRLHMPLSLTPWRSGRERPLAAVTAYGFGGANGHVLLEAAAAEPRSHRANEEHLLCLSARDEVALRALVQSYLQMLGRPEEQPALADICYTAAVGRNHFEWRAAFVVPDLVSLRGQLEQVLHQETLGQRSTRTLRPSLWFAPTWPEATVDELVRSVPLYAPKLAEVHAALGLQPKPGTLAQQTFAAQHALAQWLMTLGVNAAAFGGEGVGQLVAAVQAQMLTLQQAFAAVDGAEVLVSTVEALPQPLWVVGISTALPATSAPAHRLFDAETATTAHDDLLHALGTLYALGAKLNWTAWYASTEHRTVSLPTYPFQRKDMWFKLDQPQAPIAVATDDKAPAARYRVSGALLPIAQAPAATTAPGPHAVAMAAWLADYAHSRLDSRQIDERRCIPPHVVQDFGNAGLMGLMVPHALEGSALPVRDCLHVFEQAGAVDITLASFLGVHNVLGILPLLEGASIPLQQREVPLLASGRTLGAFAVTERGAGSNPRALASTARPQADGSLRIDGHKIWIGSGAWAGVVSIFVNEHDASGQMLGISGFAVSGCAAGLAHGPEALTMGVRGMVQNELILNGVQVTAEQRLGAPGKGLAIAQNAFHLGRLGIGAMAVGAMKRCLQLIERYAARRAISSGLLARNPVYLRFLAETVARIESVQAFVNTAASLRDSGAALPDELYAVAKIAGSEHLWQVVDGTLQFAGGRGYIETNLIPQLFRDARLLRIFEGPTEALLAFIGAAHLKGQRQLLHFLREQLGGRAVAQLEQAAARIDALIDRAGESRRRDPLLAQSTGTLLCEAALWAAAESAGNLDATTWCISRFERAVDACIAELASESADDATLLHARAARLAVQIGNVDQAALPLDELLRPDAPTRTIMPGPAMALPTPPAVRVSSSALTTNDQRAWLLQAIATRAGISVVDLDPDRPFQEYGFDSIDAVEIAHEIEEQIGRGLDPTILWNYPTPHALIEFLFATQSAGLSHAQATTGRDALMEELRRELAAS